MRKLEIAITALSGVGLLFAVIADASQRRNQTYVDPVPYEDFDASAGEEAVASPDELWRQTSLDESVWLTLLSPPDRDSEALARRLNDVATAAGGENEADPDAAAAAVRKLAGEAMAVMADAGLDQERRVARFQQILNRDFDMALIARFALGRHWRNASDAERRAYVQAFSDFVLRSYANRLVGARIESFDVTSTQLAGKQDVMVETQVAAGGNILKLVWRMRPRQGEYRVIDVVAEGISLAVTKRQEFAAILRSEGGKVSSLIRKLSDRST